MLKTILITGATGFIGYHAARYYAEKGYKVIGLDQVPARPMHEADFNAFHMMKLPHESLAEIVQRYQPDFCLHCAGNALVANSLTDPMDDFQSSVPVMFHLLDILRQFSPGCRVLFFSSAAVYGNPERLPVDEVDSIAPLSPYGYHKRMCEEICLEFARVFNLSTASIRIFSAYGPGLRKQVVWDICRKMLSHPTESLTLFGTGQESRDFIHITDILQAGHLILKNAPMQGEVYNVASGQEVTIQELANALAGKLGFKGEVAFNQQVPLGTPLNWRANIQQIEALGYQQAVSLEQGLSETANWCRQVLSPQVLVNP